MPARRNIIAIPPPVDRRHAELEGVLGLPSGYFAARAHQDAIFAAIRQSRYDDNLRRARDRAEAEMKALVASYRVVEMKKG